MGVRLDVRKFASHDCGPLAQFVKYVAIGAVATCVQMVLFYILASTCFKCLTEDDVAVRLLGFPSAAFDETAWWASRWFLAAVSTAIGFTVANVFCWVMNRLFVFRPGKFSWLVEFLLFFGVAAGATLVAIFVQSALIRFVGVTTSFAAIVEVVVSFLMNFFARRFFIFKG
jgi:putative flippase GtrA